MAKLPAEITENLWNLKRQALEIAEEAAATEFNLFDSFGETEETLSYLDELKNVAEEAETSCSRLFRLHLQIVQAQPFASAYNSVYYLQRDEFFNGTNFLRNHSHFSNISCTSSAISLSRSFKAG